jgi:apolipoprotein N-acyltransferase
VDTERLPRRRRVALGALSGALATAAFPPLDLRWMGFVCLVPLLLACRGARRRDGAIAGLAFGLVFFGVLCYWISYFGYAAWVVLVLTMTAFMVAAGAGFAHLSRSAAGRLAGAPLVWTALEIARDRVPVGGFSWGDLGYTQHAGGPVLHLARLGGVFAVTLVVVALNALIAEAARTRRAPGTPPTAEPPGGGVASAPWARRAALLVAFSLLLLAPALIPIGLAGARTSTMDVAAVQGDVPRDRFTGLGREGRVGPEDFTIVNNHLAVTRRLEGTPPPDLIVWPENSFDRDPRANTAMFDPVVAEIRKIGAPLLAGAVLDEGARWTNSNLLVSNENGAIVGRYDKVHLVPFGEYVPIPFARHIVPALDRELSVDGIAGTQVEPLTVGGRSVGTLICFESTYPELAREVVRRGAQIIVVTTNNASFGTSPAARQHLAMSQVRAVEEGRAVVHAAISGISAIVEPDGRIVRRAGLFRPALLRAALPLTDGRTPYARYGGFVELLMCSGALAALALARRA